MQYKFIKQPKRTSICGPVAVYNYIVFITKNKIIPNLSKLEEQMNCDKEGTHFTDFLEPLRVIFKNFTAIYNNDPKVIIETLDRHGAALILYWCPVFRGGHYALIIKENKKYFIINEGKVKKEISKIGLQTRCENGILIVVDPIKFLSIV